MTSRQAELDLMRAVAVLMVLFAHLSKFTEAASRLPQMGRLFVRIAEGAGWMGVDLFFVLSGFLVSGLLFREFTKYHTIRPGRFYIRRGLKIYPAFYLLMLGTVVWIVVTRYPNSTGHIFAECLFVQNYLPGIYSHTWSLAVEEHFYLLLPVFLVLLESLSRDQAAPFRHLPLGFAIIAVLCLTFRLLTSGPSVNATEKCYQNSHLRMDSLMFGVLLSYYYQFRYQQLCKFTCNHRTMITIFCLVCLGAARLPRSEWWLQTFRYSFLYLSFGSLLLLLCVPKNSRRSLVLNRAGFCWSSASILTQFTSCIFRFSWRFKRSLSRCLVTSPIL